MKVLMVGWEYPPDDRSGLGIACHGLTRALNDCGIEIGFTLPVAAGHEPASHFRLIPLEKRLTPKGRTALPAAASHQSPAKPVFARQSAHGPELIPLVQRYAARLPVRLKNEKWDVIHAHDWMTLPAALALKHKSGKKLVWQIHSLEPERCGGFANREIAELERAAMFEADHLITVGHQARRYLVEHYHVPEEKISIAYQGVDHADISHAERVRAPDAGPAVFWPGPFIGSKGPEAFVEIATRIARHLPQTRFVMAGSGEKLENIMRAVADFRLHDRFTFVGFLERPALTAILAKMDVMLLPVSGDPFGFEALEAARLGVPVVMSKLTGAAEILRHALFADHWDIDKAAQLALAILDYGPLAGDLAESARKELGTFDWRISAEIVAGIYHGLAS